jgi:hypothetical protein
MVRLARSEALELLAGVQVGRVVFSHRALPAVSPVPHILDDGHVVFRTHGGAAILGPDGGGEVVAYEADELDPAARTGWSVVITGTASLVRQEDKLTAYREALNPWGGTDRDQIIRVTADIVTGYRMTSRPR